MTYLAASCSRNPTCVFKLIGLEVFKSKLAACYMETLKGIVTYNFDREEYAANGFEVFSISA